MATRTTNKASLKSTVVDAPIKDERASSAEGFSFSDMLNGFELPSTKRVLVSFIIGVLAGGVTLYMGMQLTAMLAMGAAMLTGSAFIAFLALFMGYALSILATAVIGGKVQSFILSGDIDRTFIAAKSKVTEWLGSAREKASTFSARVPS